jgi:hypothetical protein
LGSVIVKIPFSYLEVIFAVEGEGTMGCDTGVYA